MPPSHVRKEEAELRQIARRSRLVRKEMQQRERKQRQRERRAAAKNGEAVTAAPQAAASSTPKRRGAIILPDEVQELRQRLTGADAASSAPVASAPERKTSRATTKKAARSPAKRSAVAVGTSNHSTSSSSSSSSTPTPTYRQEVHFKKKMLYVDVVLHHIPPQKIDVSETDANQLVVDTCGHTKKYRLVLPYPKGMRCDAAAATYELESGILQCRLPIVDGTIPASLEAENERMVENMRQQKALRFRVTQDGDLTVRTRQALLAPTPAAQAALQDAKKAVTAQRSDDANSDNGAADAEEREAKGKEKTGSPQSRKRVRDGDEDGKEMPQQTRSALTKKAKGAAASENAAPKEAAATSKPAVKGPKIDVFEAEHAMAMEAAKAAAAKVHLSMRERVKLAKAVQASRDERLKTRSLRKERKENQKQQSFHRVLEEQKRQLLARAAMQQPASRSSPKAKASAKTVHFADA